jgi:molybdate transport system regulatory protein
MDHMNKKEKHPPVLRLHVWMEKGDSLFFGLGRAQLLEKISTCGSLRKAAMEMNMSYRAAWGKIKKTEEVLGIKLVEKTGGNRSGYRLTKHGEQLQKNFLKWYADLEKEALTRARRDLPWPVRGFLEQFNNAPVEENNTKS